MCNNFFYYNSGIEYPQNPPYNPSTKYAEYPFAYSLNGEESCGASKNANEVYEAIRGLMQNANMDGEHIDTREWNPLKDYIKPGQTVLLKPNMVNHINKAEQVYSQGMDCLVTHPSVVRCVFDYVYIALKGAGTIIIADAPIQGCNFDELLAKTGYGQLFEFLKEKNNDDLKVVIADLREVIYKKVNGLGIQEEKSNVVYPGVVVDLGGASYFAGITDKKKLRITNYAGADTVSHHDENNNEYSISSAVLNADVIVSIPKPKSHRLAGYTGALKNMIGANARKEYLPHHRIGGVKSGGDEYIDSHQLLKYINSRSNDYMNSACKNRHYFTEAFFDNVGRITGRQLDKYEPNRFKFGMWYGNDTIWRTILDVNHAVIYADKNGKICDTAQRKMIYFGDMIVCGDHEGPLQPTYKKVGGILFSENAVEFDRIVVKLMGFNWKLIPVLKNAVQDSQLFNEENNSVLVDSNTSLFRGAVDDIEYSFNFIPTSGWKELLQ